MVTLVFTIILGSCAEPMIAIAEDKEVPSVEAINTTSITTIISTTPTTKSTTTTDTTTSTILTSTSRANSTSTTNEIITTSESSVTTTVPLTQEQLVTETKPYITYKPSTHYIHMSDCEWVSEECYKITSTENIEARLCTECNPPIEIINPYVEPTSTNSTGLSDSEIQMLRNIVSSEYGSDWVSVYDKACIVAGVMNRVNDDRFPNTIYGVLTQSDQFPGFNPYGNYYMSDSIIEAVDYYFAHTDEFGNWNSWTGDGTYNYFYCQ